MDSIFAEADLGARDGYGQFLVAQAGAHLPVEAALDSCGAGDVIPDWPARRRAAMLRADLGALGLAPPPPEAAPSLSGAPALLGAAYVLEGSRLGGAMLRRAVPDTLPHAFLSSTVPGAWRDLVCLLDARLTSREDIDQAIAAACAVFALFARSGRRFLQGDALADQR